MPSGPHLSGLSESTMTDSVQRERDGRLEQYAQTHPMPPSVHPMLARWMDHWLTRFSPTAAVLELGSGDGRILRHLRETHPRLRILGLEASMIRCRRMAQDLLPCVYSTQPPLPVAPQSIDLLISFEVIEHIPRAVLREYIAEFRRVLKPTGMLWVSTPNYPFKRYVDIREYLRGRRRTWRDDPTHVTRFSWRSLRTLLLEVFSDVEVRSSAISHPDDPTPGACGGRGIWRVHKMHGFAFGPALSGRQLEAAQ